MKAPDLALIALCAFMFVGCGDNMSEQAKYKSYSSSTLFDDGSAMRPLIPGVVAQLPPTSPQPPTTPDLLARGRERFDIYCSPCHGRVGDGRGRIVQRGFPSPPSYHQDRLRKASDRHFYNVMTHGYGVMFSYANRVSPTDRWAIVAYIRALQRSQNARLADLPPKVRAELEAGP